MLDEIVKQAPLFVLVVARILAMIETSPLLSSDSIPQIAKISLAGFVSFVAFPMVNKASYVIPPYILEYGLLVVGEAFIGIIIGTFLNIIYSAFSTAGQFFSTQMGLSASETFDPLAQIEIPIIGQFLNLIAMLVFLVNSGFQKLFILGVQGTFSKVSAYSIVTHKDDIILFMLKALSGLFEQSLILSFPILGTLFLVSVGMGLLAKASPHMNLLTEGFPISIMTAWVLLLAGMPFMIEAFGRIISVSFDDLAFLLSGLGK